MRDSELSMNIPLFKDIPHVGSFWHLLIINLYFLYSPIWLMGMSFWYPWTILSSKIYNMLGLSGTLSYNVFVYLYFCICLFDSWKYHFWYPWTILFSKVDQGALGMSDPLGPLQLALKPNSASSINRPLLNFYYCKKVKTGLRERLKLPQQFRIIIPCY